MNSNFDFLARFPILWKRFGNATDLTASHPDAALGELRVTAELLADEIGRKNGAPRRRERGSEEKQEAYIDRLLSVGCISNTQAQDFHWIRRIGNKSSHGEKLIPTELAQKALSTIKRLALDFRGDLTTGGDTSDEIEPTEDEETVEPTDEVREEERKAVRPPARLKLFLWIALVGGLLVLGFAAYLLQASPTWPQTYTVEPGGNSPTANVRSGGSAEFRVVRSLSRGTVVVGVSDTLDRKDARWIKLSDGTGYMKASVLQLQAKPFAFDEAISRVVSMWGLLIIVVVSVLALSIWKKIRISSAATLVLVALGAFYYRATIAFWWEHPYELVYSATRPIAELGSVPRQSWMQPASTLRCNLLSHCSANLISDQETDSIAFAQIDGQPANVHLCTNIPIWYDQNGPPRIRVHGWFGGRDLGILSMTRSVADQLRSNPGAELPVDQVAFSQSDPSVHSFEYWFVYGTCDAGPS